MVRCRAAGRKGVMTSYAKRASLFEKGEQTWTVMPEARPSR